MARPVERVTAQKKEEALMSIVAELHEGMIIIINERLYKILSITFGGSAKAERLYHIGMKGIPDGIHSEKTFRGDDKIDAAEIERHVMQYMYTDGNDFFFMNKDTF